MKRSLPTYFLVWANQISLPQGFFTVLTGWVFMDGSLDFGIGGNDGMVADRPCAGDGHVVPDAGVSPHDAVLDHGVFLHRHAVEEHALPQHAARADAAA